MVRSAQTRPPNTHIEPKSTDRSEFGQMCPASKLDLLAIDGGP